MVELRCNNCPHLQQGFCTKLKEAIPNGLAKLFYGGAEGVYSGSVTYASKCGIETEKVNEEDLDLVVIVPEKDGDNILENVKTPHGKT